MEGGPGVESESLLLAVGPYVPDRKSRAPACLPACLLWVLLWVLARLGIEHCGEEGFPEEALMCLFRLLLLWHIVGARRMNKRSALLSN